jgi:hypothetical protein
MHNTVSPKTINTKHKTNSFSDSKIVAEVKVESGLMLEGRSHDKTH